MPKNAKPVTTPATVQLDEAGVAYVLHSYVHDARSTEYGAEASGLLGIDPARMFKTLMVNSGRDFAVALVPVAALLDVKALGVVLGLKKLGLADPAAAQRRTGYVLGGISPLGQRTLSPTVIDDSAASWRDIYVSGGRRGVSLQLSARDLARITGAQFAPIANFN